MKRKLFLIVLFLIVGFISSVTGFYFGLQSSTDYFAEKVLLAEVCKNVVSCRGDLQTLLDNDQIADRLVIGKYLKLASLYDHLRVWELKGARPFIAWTKPGFYGYIPDTQEYTDPATIGLDSIRDFYKRNQETLRAIKIPEQAKSVFSFFSEVDLRNDSVATPVRTE